jgi:hypothetical protein
MNWINDGRSKLKPEGKAAKRQLKVAAAVGADVEKQDQEVEFERTTTPRLASTSRKNTAQVDATRTEGFAKRSSTPSSDVPRFNAKKSERVPKRKAQMSTRPLPAKLKFSECLLVA